MEKILNELSEQREKEAQEKQALKQKIAELECVIDQLKSKIDEQDTAMNSLLTENFQKPSPETEYFQSSFDELFSEMSNLPDMPVALSREEELNQKISNYNLTTVFGVQLSQVLANQGFALTRLQPSYDEENAIPLFLSSNLSSKADILHCKTLYNARTDLLNRTSHLQRQVGLGNNLVNFVTADPTRSRVFKKTCTDGLYMMHITSGEGVVYICPEELHNTSIDYQKCYCVKLNVIAEDLLIFRGALFNCPGDFITNTVLTRPISSISVTDFVLNIFADFRLGGFYKEDGSRSNLTSIRQQCSNSLLFIPRLPQNQSLPLCFFKDSDLHLRYVCEAEEINELVTGILNGSRTKKRRLNLISFLLPNENPLGRWMAEGFVTVLQSMGFSENQSGFFLSNFGTNDFDLKFEENDQIPQLDFSKNIKRKRQRSPNDRQKRLKPSQAVSSVSIS